MELSKQIKKYRLKLNLSQEELADKLYVSRQSISNWENDKTYPDIQTLLLISSLFNITLDELIKGDIEKMKKEINEDVKNYYKYVTIFSGLFALFLISVVPLYHILDIYGLFVSILIAILVLFYSYKIENIKNKHDIKTYKEILAFLNNENIDEIRKERKINKYDFIIKMFIGAILALIVIGIMELFF